MKKLFTLITLFGLFALPGSAIANEQVLTLISMDKQFLGYVNSNAYDGEGFCNPYSNHGSQYSSLSIFNQYGNYGSQHSDFSAYNKRARRPPMLFQGRTPIGFVTKNRQLPGAIDPDILRIQICEQ